MKNVIMCRKRGGIVMKAYLIPIQMGFMIFPFLAALFTLPYMILQYRKYGAMLFLRILIVYSMILYILCAYFMVILPLPKEDIPRLTQTMQLVPFHFIKEIAQRHFSTIVSFIKCPQVYQAFFNLLLTLPLGVYLKYYFQKKWYHVLIYGFLFSLSFELLQLTGLLGVYKYPYRLFDVDDLIVNTLGTMCGFIMTPLFEKILPNRQQLDQQSYAKGKDVSFVRRTLAFVVDALFLFSATIIFQQFNVPFSYLLTYIFMVVFYFGILTYCFQGQTFGMKLVKIALKGHQQQQPTFLQCIKRYSVLLLEVYIIPCYIIGTFYYSLTLRTPFYYILWVEIGIIGFFFVLFAFKIFFVVFIKNDEMIFEKFSNTHCISLVHEKRHEKKP